jgi:hypothetical protein
MKSKFKLFNLLLALALLWGGFKASAEEKTKELHQGWTVNSVQTLGNHPRGYYRGSAK